MPSLLLVDDHPVVHVALEAALMKSSRTYRLQAVPDDAQALTQLEAAAFSLVILDIGLPQTDGLQLLKKIRRRYPQQPILIYTAQEEDIYARMAYAAGANGFVHKGSALERLVQAIEQVLDGGLSFPAAAMAEDRRPTDGTPLTPKELEVLGLLSKGLSNLQIAEMLHISNKTVSTHKKNILRKTGAHNLLELVAVFRELAP
ncbi:response regulator transcription factor [Serratia entomophila]|uniref:response regulator transcription factor n=1 Tax=Serratia entomophila TaxID=42906 RepID=UPI00217BE7C3|nr:response regulator transcription factor [Serratia entomophila]CAI0913352.1 Virulence factors putative positive transcription regulator BvgA [Serratia entomophila]CAI0916820.1 Virulence factors putative positive transcription regulator BvgA [Serratia entomophila]CAI0922161.1 Virulence factors putative positive transcription regulator BvgA [Serratia entomophila]CAI0976285.1 Virulence factors putative positive transcription regulator BvgA [Serratia entomophila]CAI1604232.1 Virulence factors pu